MFGKLLTSQGENKGEVKEVIDDLHKAEINNNLNGELWDDNDEYHNFDADSLDTSNDEYHNFDADSLDTSNPSLHEEVGCTPSGDVDYTSMSEKEVEEELSRLMKGVNVPAHELKFRELAKTLETITLDKRGKLVMHRNDWVIFRNSILFTSMFYHALMR